MTRASAVQLLASAPAFELAPKPTASGRILLDQLRTAIVVGDHHIGLLEESSTIVVSTTSTVRRYNVPRPPVEQRYWATQSAPLEPVTSVAQLHGDVSYGANPDEFGAVTRIGAYMVLALYVFTSHAYLARFEPTRGIFQTRALPFGGLVRGVYGLSADTVGIVRPDGTCGSVDLPHS